MKAIKEAIAGILALIVALSRKMERVDETILEMQNTIKRLDSQICDPRFMPTEETTEPIWSSDAIWEEEDIDSELDTVIPPKNQRMTDYYLAGCSECGGYGSLIAEGWVPATPDKAMHRNYFSIACKTCAA